MLKYCSIGSGSSGNCHYVGYKDTNILIDAAVVFWYNISYDYEKMR